MARGQQDSEQHARVAIAHDYLTQRGGAERVVLSLARAFPNAPIFTTLYDPQGTYPEFAGFDVRPSWLNRVGPLRRNHRVALPLLPLAATSIRVDADLVIASSSGWAHGFRAEGRKLVYCYSPARWLYDSKRYLGTDNSGVERIALRLLSPLLTKWDKRAAGTADRYLAISSVAQERIRLTYGLEADIVPAPHNMNSEILEADSTKQLTDLPEPGFLLVVSRLLPYKNVDEIVRTFATRPDLRLVIIGSGPQKQELVRLSTSNVTFMEGVSDQKMRALYARCAGLLAAAYEDFGLTPLEAASFGRPSAVLRWGGFLDTVIEGESGVFFDEPQSDAIGDAIDELLAREWDEAVLRQRAREFSEEVFIKRLKRHVDELLAQ